MTVTLLAPHWSANARIQRAANGTPMRAGESDKAAVKLLQEALIAAGFAIPAGATGNYMQQTAAAVVAAERRFGFRVDAGIAGREVIGALDLRLRGWNPAAGQLWGGELARTVLPVAQRKITGALRALGDIETQLATGGFDFVTADGVTMAALRTHFKLVPPGGMLGGGLEAISRQTIDPLVKNYRGLQRTLSNPAMIRHSICTLGLNTAAEAPFGGPILFGPPFSSFTFAPVGTTNIAKTGVNSLAAMIMHEGTHVIDSSSGDDATTHISEFTPGYVTQPARHARHNPSAFATFAAHIDEGKDREPPNRRYGLGDGRPE